MIGGPLSSLNQALFTVQSVILSLGQAVQIVGMNTAALQQLLESAAAMMNHAIHVYKELRVLELASQQTESLEDKKKRRRLRALRWCIMVGVSYAAYKLVRVALFGASRRRRIDQHSATTGSSGSPLSTSIMAPYANLYNSTYNQPLPLGGLQGPSPFGSGYYGGGSPYF